MQRDDLTSKKKLGSEVLTANVDSNYRQGLIAAYYNCMKAWFHFTYGVPPSGMVLIN